MSRMRLGRWTATGAAVGASFALLALTDARQIVPYFLRPSDRIDFYLCWWEILEFAPWHHSLVLFYLLVIFLNACTYALLFLVLGAIISSIFSRSTVKTAGGTQ